MKKLMIMSIMLASISLESRPVKAGIEDCTPQTMIPILQKSSIKNQQFVVPDGESYAVYINNKTVSFLDQSTRAELSSAQVSNTSTQWFPSANTSYAYCEITIKNVKNPTKITTVQLYPSTTTKKPRY